MKKIILAILLLFSAVLSKAQPFTMNPDIVPTELNLYDFKPAGKDQLAGRMNVTEVTQDKDTLYFFAKNFSIYSPAYVGITAEDKAADLKIGLFTENWLKPVQGGNTADSGHWEKRFKVEGDFGIRVIVKTKPVKYSLVIWNGKDVEVAVPTAFSYNQDAKGGGDSFFKKNWMYIAIGVLLLAVIILFIKRKKS